MRYQVGFYWSGEEFEKDANELADRGWRVHSWHMDVDADGDQRFVVLYEDSKQVPERYVGDLVNTSQGVVTRRSRQT